MNHRFLGLFLFVSGIILCGCNSYLSRTVVQSFSRIGVPIAEPTHHIENPVLPNVNLAVSWVGHATMLIQIHDKIILTDPLFTETIGMLVKRFVQPGLDAARFSHVDCTLISHRHFDHLSFGSLDKLPKSGALFVSEGVAAYTPEFGFRAMYEMKPWDVVEDDSIKITAVPVQHFTGRYGFDAAWMGSAGYTGYIIEYHGITVFFAGDTGYEPERFKDIGRRFKIDLAIVPIAPGSSSGFGSRVHVNPAGALEIFKDVGAKYFMPMHFGAFYYGHTPNADEQLTALRSAAASQGISERIIVLEVGEQKVVF